MFDVLDKMECLAVKLHEGTIIKNMVSNDCILFCEAHCPACIWVEAQWVIRNAQRNKRLDLEN